MPSALWTRGAAIGVIALLASACAGVETGGSATLPSPTTQPGAEASPTPAAQGETIAGCPNFVEVVETGPLPGDDGTEDGPVAREQQRISDDVDAAAAYGAEHPDEFGSIRYENGPRVRLVIGFTDHIAEHCTELRELLAFPEEFEIIRVVSTGADLERLQQEIVDLARPFLRSAGSGAGGIVEVSLRADGEAMAAEIQARYGDLVRITVGLLSFPDRQLPDEGGCGLPLEQIDSDTPFRASLQLDAGVVHPGGDFAGTVRVTNLGIAEAAFESGSPMTAMVFEPGTSDVIGVYTGGIGGVGVGRELGPLESIDIDFLGGTASCDPALGYALPPGTYEIRVLVDQYTMHDNAPTEISYLLSQPAALTIEP